MYKVFLLLTQVNIMNAASQIPTYHVFLWDKSQNNVGSLVMATLRDPMYPSHDRLNFMIGSPVGLMKVSSGGWESARLGNEKRIYVILQNQLEVDLQTAYQLARVFLPGDKMLIVVDKSPNQDLRRQEWIHLSYSFVECDLRNLNRQHFLSILTRVSQDPREILNSAYFKTS